MTCHCQKLREALIWIITEYDSGPPYTEVDWETWKQRAQIALAHPCTMPTDEEAEKAADKNAGNLPHGAAYRESHRSFLAGVRFGRGEK